MSSSQKFAKIKLDIAFTKKARRGPLVIEYGPIKYYKVLGNPFRFDLLKAWQPDRVFWVEIEGPLEALPHRDHGLTCALNLYVQSGGCRTQFWEALPTAVPLKYSEEEAQANIFRTGELVQTESFVANDGDTYLLDVSSVHSVNNTPDSFRQFIQISWKTKPFDQVLAMVRASTETPAPE